MHINLLDSGETDCNKLSVNKIIHCARRKLVFLKFSGCVIIC